jgi:hypothetical protein
MAHPILLTLDGVLIFEQLKKKLLVDDMLMIIGSPYVVLPVIYRYIGD